VVSRANPLPFKADPAPEAAQFVPNASARHGRPLGEESFGLPSVDGASTFRFAVGRTSPRNGDQEFKPGVGIRLSSNVRMAATCPPQLVLHHGEIHARVCGRIPRLPRKVRRMRQRALVAFRPSGAGGYPLLATLPPCQAQAISSRSGFGDWRFMPLHCLPLRRAAGGDAARETISAFSNLSRMVPLLHRSCQKKKK